MPQQSSSRYSISGFRRALASIDSVPQFALLGICSGIVTGLVILVFRGLMEIPLEYLLDEGSEAFESLPVTSRFALPLMGGVLLALLFSLIPTVTRRVGVIHVLERLGRHQGHMPWQNAVTQFIGGIIALGTGQSGGREGPAIHLGAACSSLLGQSLQLPNNSIRILVGCGAAAAISASFNTPIAGVIFSMEVILMEYTIAGFIPVILAAVIATLINPSVYGSSLFSTSLGNTINNFYNLPFLIVEGVVIGTLAATFVYLVKKIHQFAPESHWVRMLIAGLATALIALASPQILGIGYDTVLLAHSGELTIYVLLLACVLKIIATAITIGLGVPVGVIGPALFIGATAGGVLGYICALIAPDLAAPAGYYVILGMGAMMGAVLQAPLAALMAVMELTQNPGIILPAMLVIIVANMTSGQVFHMKSVFLMQMEMIGLEFRQNPLSMALNRSAVASIMSRSFERVSAKISRPEAMKIIEASPDWLLVNDSDPADNENGPVFILRTLDLTAFLAGAQREQIDLNEIPATRKDVAPILLQATLQEALDVLNDTGLQALYVNRISSPMFDSVVGIVTREDIESYYQG
ncbi:MAG: chloride channel protein [bacterium]